MVWTCIEEVCGYTEKRMLNKKIQSRRKKGRPQTRFMDAVKEDIQRVGVTRRHESSSEEATVVTPKEAAEACCTAKLSLSYVPSCTAFPCMFAYFNTCIHPNSCFQKKIL